MTTALNDVALHVQLAKQPPQLRFDPSRPLAEQRGPMEARFRELLGFSRMPERPDTVLPVLEYASTEDARFDEIRFHFVPEPDFAVPCHMLLPKDRRPGEKLPVVICLQGHSTGMHISMGRKKFPRDEESLRGGDRDFALQIVARGYIAVAMEQRGLGELSPKVAWGGTGTMCHVAAMSALSLGRTIQGERAYDVSCLIDALEQFAVLRPGFDVSLDLERLAMMGKSGGGTTTYHAACVEPRIKVMMPSCSFNTYAASIMSLYHCTCNYIPDIVRWMEMPDLAVLLAPRPLIIVSGREDPIFPLEAVQEGFAEVQQIYTAAGKPENCRLIIGDGAHRFYAADAWPVFDRYI